MGHIRMQIKQCCCTALLWMVSTEGYRKACSNVSQMSQYLEFRLQKCPAELEEIFDSVKKNVQGAGSYLCVLCALWTIHADPHRSVELIIAVSWVQQFQWSFQNILRVNLQVNTPRDLRSLCKQLQDVLQIYTQDILFRYVRKLSV